MKRALFLCVLVSVLGCSCALGSEENLRLGFLARLRTNEDEFYRIIKESWQTQGWSVLGGNHDTASAYFYDSLNVMIMALRAGQLDEIILPDFTAEYLMRTDKTYRACCVSNSGRMGLCFGFMEDNGALADMWNSALAAMKNDWTLTALEQKYLKDFPDASKYYEYDPKTGRKKDPYAIRFERFTGAPTVRVAITGDIPPVDFIGPDGFPAGYNAAVLAELGRRLKMNIEVISVNAGSRTAALVSGRADVVFWYEVHKTLPNSNQPDIPEGVIISSPYLEWDKFIHLCVAE